MKRAWAERQRILRYLKLTPATETLILVSSTAKQIELLKNNA
jgi:hypothetical protein